MILAPAMNCEMWDKPAVQRNVAQLRADGFPIIDPEEGYLSCGQVGAGRMASPEKIFRVIAETLEKRRRRFVRRCSAEPCHGRRFRRGVVGRGSAVDESRRARPSFAWESFEDSSDPAMARILITSGPTRQYLDPVRYLTNASSGRMGSALAAAALDARA